MDPEVRITQLVTWLRSKGSFDATLEATALACRYTKEEFALAVQKVFPTLAPPGAAAPRPVITPNQNLQPGPPPPLTPANLRQPLLARRPGHPGLTLVFGLLVLIAAGLLIWTFLAPTQAASVFTHLRTLLHH